MRQALPSCYFHEKTPKCREVADHRCNDTSKPSPMLKGNQARYPAWIFEIRTLQKLGQQPPSPMFHSPEIGAV